MTQKLWAIQPRLWPWIEFFSSGGHEPRHLCMLQQQPFTRSKHLLISWLYSLSTVILEPKKIKSITISTFPPIYWPWSYGTRRHGLSFLNVEFLSQLFHSPLLLALKGSLIPLHSLPLKWYHLPPKWYIWSCWHLSWQSWYQFMCHPTQHFTWYTLPVC